ncbi:MAG TPA: glucose-6-phosphate dehydrogenase [Candidatus Saccharimonadales bacterium]|nr:glucose-6-phosphate dehydrogenase [Candidatus Saccharimonadales bacterium]
METRAGAVPENPFRAGLPEERSPSPCAMVIFGATGDLTSRKLLPALYNLALDRVLPPGFKVVGFARREWNDDEFREVGRTAVSEHSRRPLDDPAWQEFGAGIHYLQGDFGNPEAYRDLRERLKSFEAAGGGGRNRIFYLATPPSSYETIVKNLGASGVVHGHGDSPFSRIIVEKPFGRDLGTARELNGILAGSFREEQIYRIDHYLGKETVQNILVLRFANGIFEPVWNRRHVDHVQITAAESLGVEGRGAYFNEAGSLRDMVQNHMMQLLCLMAMEPPVTLRPDAVRDEKLKVLEAIPLPSIEEVARMSVRGQYARGSMDGRYVDGFTSEKNVPPDSRTETFAALRLEIDNWRWAGVPFFLRTGKRLPRRVTEIAIQFKAVPHRLFTGPGSGGIRPNVLALRIQPDEGISLKFSSKVPGSSVRIRPVKMDFRYGTSFGEAPPEAYERLILDCLLGDSTLFTRRDEVEAAWRLITRVLEGWRSADGSPVPLYEAGTWGPQEAHSFIGASGREWRHL